ncbi:MAG: saccharopine dehydrogenase NADP-binding domain-containing protein [Phototrophicales bacterium]|nr:saccharopine dehydrogenase NADP-binding domain-containing protein [Phototrophicales bacterium]
MSAWMIYGATGYTGRLLVEEAVARGHNPIIAGRSGLKLKAIADQYGLDYVVFDLIHPSHIAQHLHHHQITAVLHVAGPFVHTSQPMVTACLESGTHYLDITGEISVYEALFALDEQAKQAGIAILPGVGFDIVPSDCLCKYVSAQCPEATQLEVVISALNITENDFGMTAGTLKSFVEMLPTGSKIRRNGKLQPIELGRLTRDVKMPHGDFSAMAIPWGDVSTAYRTTGIPNITAYMVTAPSQINALKVMGYPLQWMLKIDPLRGWLGRQIDRRIPGPSEHTRQTGRTYIYAHAQASDRFFAEAWLECVEGYRFTASAGILAVERILTGNYIGALTPAGAFGADFVLEIDGTYRYDVLPEMRI